MRSHTGVIIFNLYPGWFFITVPCCAFIPGGHQYHPSSVAHWSFSKSPFLLIFRQFLFYLLQKQSRFALCFHLNKPLCIKRTKYIHATLFYLKQAKKQKYSEKCAVNFQELNKRAAPPVSNFKMQRRYKWTMKISSTSINVVNIIFEGQIQGFCFQENVIIFFFSKWIGE